jgi:hypothetical protein
MNSKEAVAAGTGGLNRAVSAPVAVGGVGGSGTRLIARLMMDLGYFMGGDLNESLDNLWFTLLFKRPMVLTAPDDSFSKLVSLFVGRMSGEWKVDPSSAELIDALVHENRLPEFPPEWVRDRATSLVDGHGVAAGERWGWKEPNTHFIVPRLRRSLSGLKYIHVMRNGLDMAHSSNQNQLRLWGPILTGQEIEISPKASLKFWRLVHERILAVGNDMGDDFLLLKYEDFCAQPLSELLRLLEFLGMSISLEEQASLAAKVIPPASIDRFKLHGIDLFDASDVAFVAALGYDVNPDLGPTG